MRTTFTTNVSDAEITTSRQDLNIFSKVAAAFRVRRQRRELMTLDDRMLADIGISRAQAYGEADRPFFDMPPSLR